MPWIALDPATAQAAPVVMTGAPKTSVGATLQVLQADLIRVTANRADVVNNVALQTRWINEGYRHLCSMLDLPQLHASWSLDTVVDQPLYKLPIVAAGFESVAAIHRVGTVDTTNYFQGGTPLDPIDEQKYRTLPDRSDEPSRYFRFGEMLVLWPTPIAARTLVIDGILRPQDLVAATDSPILPPEWHTAIPLAAKAAALRDLREYSAQQLAENDLVAHIRVITDYPAEEKSKRFSRITPIRKWSDLRRSR